jgi:MoaA/NifB/PqqE/SkfB family radical SAM enzyme
MDLNDLPTESFCILPWTSAVVQSGGHVVPCCLWITRENDYAKEHNIEVAKVQDGLETDRNGEFFKTVRQQMLNGEKPSGCSYCWKQESNKSFNKLVEDGTVNHIRVDRHRVYADPTKTDYDINPEPLSFLETGLSNTCNFACVMCNTSCSSIIWGIYNKGKSVPKGFSQTLDNLDEDFSNLTLVKIIGGEPMVEKKHDDLLDKIISQNKNPKNLTIEYHTNASIFPSQRVIDQWKKLKSVRIIFSMDSVGKYAELQRPGNYKWEDVENVVDKYVQLAKAGVPIIFSANIVLTALNIQYITETVDWLHDKLSDSETSWFNCNPINKDKYKYIDFRNLSKETKQRIKDKWTKWELSDAPVLYSKKEFIHIFKLAKAYIDEEGELTQPLTEELMLKHYHYAETWKRYNVDLSTLNLLP